MANEINWNRQGYQSRVDTMADVIDDFVNAVLATIDVDAARASPKRWETVCRFFAGCRRAALEQRGTAEEGGKRIGEYLATEFPLSEYLEAKSRFLEGSNDGFYEFMDWLSNPTNFHPSALRSALENCSA